MATILNRIEILIDNLIDKLLNKQELIIEVNKKKIKFLSSKSCLRFSLYLKCLSLIHHLIVNNIYSTKRDLYYQYKDLFKTQIVLNDIIDDLVYLLNVQNRSYLNIISTSKGLIAGHLQFYDSKNNYYDCTKTNNGILIAQDSFNLVNTQAKFMIIIEKDASFQRLLDDGFIHKYKAILITVSCLPLVHPVNLLKSN